MNNKQLKELALEYLKTYWHDCPWMLVLNKVEWTNLGIRKAGCYLHYQKSIQLNTAILDKPGMEQGTKDALLHELIHVWQRNHPDEKIKREPPHGRAFRSQMYRLNGILGREAITTYHNYQMPGNERILRKAMALLARTKSNNEHEAAIAAAKFTTYMQQYELQLSEKYLVLASELPELVDQVVAISRVADSWRKILLSSLAYLNACQLFWRNQSGFVEWHMIGREHRLDQVVLLYDYLEEAITRLVTTQQKIARQEGFSKGRAYWNAFRVGIANNIYQRLKADFEIRMHQGIKVDNNQESVSALVVQNWHIEENNAVSAFVAAKNYSFVRGRNYCITSVAGYYDGHNAGNTVSINQQIKPSSPPQINTLWNYNFLPHMPTGSVKN
ncbi:MAG: hypothetical protein F6K10_41505 [Moorea sp. SIO2B7]|nr:hypothetical protein [Moorena sp. SIO2B7]